MNNKKDYSRFLMISYNWDKIDKEVNEIYETLILR